MWKGGRYTCGQAGAEVVWPCGKEGGQTRGRAGVEVVSPCGKGRREEERTPEEEMSRLHKEDLKVVTASPVGAHDRMRWGRLVRTDDPT